ncbi:protein translocase, SecG subunit [Desulfitobacterium dichloroeliminans LMG P-21439]|uniref:Protein-export membrane protein SecG n=1 Tax=Desulfitobacterium dichloroeliminans (strain LMG P-21439 / DCA1) TaxID=871963 RepID=L0FC08_DESDL|nr:preprotein translocase subunit SecG [Desulfitobacterium dichloroeliminans]AGA70757.1 protein translocase, SecG subunit [Desulfitobacterium dichloroeliminans LMG P-21439]
MVIFLTILLVVSSLGLIATVLLQSGVSAGLGAIGGASESFFGKKKGLDAVFQKLSIISAVVFLLSSLGVAYLIR